LCIKSVKYWDKYTEMYGQQNVKNFLSSVTMHKTEDILSKKAKFHEVFFKNFSSMFGFVSLDMLVPK